MKAITECCKNERLEIRDWRWRIVNLQSPIFNLSLLFSLLALLFPNQTAVSSSTTACQPTTFTSPLLIPLDVDKSFGPRLLPNSGTTRYDFHRGIDWDAPNGTPVYAVADGTVKSFEDSWVSGIGSGNYVHLLHPADNCETRYNHLDAVHPSIMDGVAVTMGQLIGWVGTTGAFGDHLHFETRMGNGVSQRSTIHPLQTPFIAAPNGGTPTVEILAAQVGVGGVTAVVSTTKPAIQPDIIQIQADAGGSRSSINFETLNHTTQEVAALDDPFVDNTCVIPFALNVSNGQHFLLAFHELDGPAASVTAEVSDVFANTGTVTEPILGGVTLAPALQTGAGVPGETAVFNYTLTNDSGSDDTFDLQHYSAQGWMAVVSPTNPTLADGESITVSVTVAVNGASFGPPDCGILLATPQNAPERSGVGIYRLTRHSYVSSSSGNDGNSGGQANPFATISHAIDETAAGGIIHIAEGNYQENLTLSKTVHLLGGYSNDWASRTFALNNTRVDGNQQGSALHISGDYGPLVEGLTLTNGLSSSGGGVWLSGGAAPVLQNNWIVQNTATSNGGGVYVASGTIALTLLNNTISDNVAQSGLGGGGGIYISGRTVLLQNNVIRGNQATLNDGGGLYVTGGANVTLLDVDVQNNAADNGGGISLRSGSSLRMATAVSSPSSALPNGVPCQTALLPPDQFCVMVRDNSAVGNGGGIYVQGGSQLSIDQAGLLDNSAGNGGAIYSLSVGDVLSLTNSRVSGNTGTYGLRLWQAATLTAVHTTLADNLGTAVGINNASSTVSFENSIVWGNGGGIASNAVLGGWCNISQDGTLAGTNEDPLFGTTPRGRYHLASGSPAIDACNSGESADLDGLSRPFGGDFDQGAFEQCSSPAPLSPSSTISYVDGMVSLSWANIPTNEMTIVYRGGQPYFVDGVWVTAVTSDHVLDAAGMENRFYHVLGATCGGNETAVADELGVFHFTLESGS